jgi:CRISPR-associated protein Cas1
VCAQALILRDNGYTCHEAVLYYSATKQRVRVAIDDALVGETVQAIAAARALAESGRIPAPLVDSPKCPRCSLVPICLPDETAAALSLPSAADATQQLSLFTLDPPPSSLHPSASPPTEGRTAEGSPDEIRRLVPARDDLRPLYVTGHSLSIGKSGEVLQIRDKRKLVQETRVGEISQLNVFGNVQLSAAALQGLCWAEKPIAHFSFGGWFYGLTQGLGLKNVFLRRDQFRCADVAAFGLRVARDIVASKIRNQRTLLQRNHIEPPPLVLQRLKRLAQQAIDAAEMDELLGIEGSATRLYFEHFNGMLKVEAGGNEAPPAFDFQHRNRRPPRDPINALLSFAYSLLTKDLTIICHSIGFDPFIGFYHQPRFGRPALALDLMEGFRPLVADRGPIEAEKSESSSLPVLACSGRRGPSHLDMDAAVGPACARQCQLIETTCDAGCGHDMNCWGAYCYPAEGRCSNRCPIVEPRRAGRVLPRRRSARRVRLVAEGLAARHPIEGPGALAF